MAVTQLGGGSHAQSAAGRLGLAPDLAFSIIDRLQHLDAARVVARSHFSCGDPSRGARLEFPGRSQPVNATPSKSDDC